MISLTCWSTTDHPDRLAVRPHLRPWCAQSYRSSRRFRSSALWIYLAPNSGGYFAKRVVSGGDAAVAVALDGRPGQREGAPRGARERGWRSFCSPPTWAGPTCRFSGRIPPAARWRPRTRCCCSLARRGRCRSCPGTATSASWLFGAWSLGIAVVAAFSLAGASGPRPQQVPVRDPLPAPGGLRQRQRGAGGDRRCSWRSASRPTATCTRALAGCSWPRPRCWRTSRCSPRAAGRRSGHSGGHGRLPGLRPRPPAGRVPAGGARRGGGAGAGPLLDVYNTGEVGGALGPALDDAVAAVGLGAPGGGAGRGARRWRSGRRAAPRARSAQAGGGPRPPRRCSRPRRWWSRRGQRRLDLGQGRQAVDDAHRRRVHAGGGRADHEPRPVRAPRLLARGHRPLPGAPVGGVGTGNFEREYTARRHEPKHSRYVHNMFLRALGEGGLRGRGPARGLLPHRCSCPGRCCAGGSRVRRRSWCWPRRWRSPRTSRCT